MPNLFNGTHSYWDHRWLEDDMPHVWGNEEDSLYWGNCLFSWNYLFILPLSIGKFHLCWLMEDSFPDFVSCNNVVTLPSKIPCCLIVQGFDKGLLKSSALTPHGRFYQEGGIWVSGGCSSQPWPDSEMVQQVFSCFLCIGREILIIKHSTNV